eukprot:TRINITY_DN11029_c0_g1_i2.p1 TRINITY_DN11029_c0_g1~~TRINITY_DN11029_c0_g1_i2.p1  ORF type:complete len:468 (-),score=81.38 TRINITY_DN11029_c0_g1_i2:28-1299(-)
MWEVISSIALLRSSNKELELFAQFLEGSRPTEEFYRYLKVRRLAHDVLVGVKLPLLQASANIQEYLCLKRALHIAHILFPHSPPSVDRLMAQLQVRAIPWSQAEISDKDRKLVPMSSVGGAAVMATPRTARPPTATPSQTNGSSSVRRAVSSSWSRPRSAAPSSFSSSSPSPPPPSSSSSLVTSTRLFTPSLAQSASLARRPQSGLTRSSNAASGSSAPSALALALADTSFSSANTAAANNHPSLASPRKSVRTGTTSHADDDDDDDGSGDTHKSGSEENDASSDRCVTLAEFMSLLLAEFETVRLQTLLSLWTKNLFEMIDSNGDGFVDYHGFARLCRTAQPAYSERLITHLYGNIRRNAGTDQISLSTFEKFCYQLLREGVSFSLMPLPPELSSDVSRLHDVVSSVLATYSSSSQIDRVQL